MLLPGVVLSALCLLLPICGNAIPTPPLPPTRVELIPSMPSSKDTAELTNHIDLHRAKRNLDIGGILKTIGVGVDVGGPQLNFNAPNVTLDTPLGAIVCPEGGSRSRRDDGGGRRGEAESMEMSEERTERKGGNGLSIKFGF
uniref:Uncharacterized protein n=1 Tax=Anopheles coluzzii TaxID=1518534 RepID=A0A8W7PGS7_ANOCL